MVKTKVVQRPNGRKSRANQAPRSNGNGGAGAARTPLLPTGVNNNATMPNTTHEYHLGGEEIIQLINVNNTTPGQIVLNTLIDPQSTLRLRIMSGAFQRIDWKKASIHLVALNGSVVTSGYTMGFVEDPEVLIPTIPSAVIPFLTALRKTTVRQAWVESEAGVQVSLADKPEMFTQPGSDIRRHSPGRVVIAATGDVGTAPTTFMVMLKYQVRLFVPAGLENIANEIGLLNAYSNVVVGTNSLSSSPWSSGTVLQGQSFRLLSDMLCLVAGNEPERNLRVVSTGTLVTLGLNAGNLAITSADVPVGESWVIAAWDGPNRKVIPMTSVPGAKYGYSGTEI
nr:MAG: putative capsid protein [Tombusviridae sp.]